MRNGQPARGSCTLERIPIGAPARRWVAGSAAHAHHHAGTPTLNSIPGQPRRLGVRAFIRTRDFAGRRSQVTKVSVVSRPWTRQRRIGGLGLEMCVYGWNWMELANWGHGHAHGQVRAAVCPCSGDGAPSGARQRRIEAQTVDCPVRAAWYLVATVIHGEHGTRHLYCVIQLDSNSNREVDDARLLSAGFRCLSYSFS